MNLAPASRVELFPAIDMLDGKAVRLTQGDYARSKGYREDPVEVAREFADAGAQWVHVVDLDGARTGVPANIAILERIAGLGTLKVETGGGVRSKETVARLLDAGVTRCVLGTKLAQDPGLTRELCEQYGDAIVAGVDARDGEVAVEGWTQGSGIDAKELVGRLRDLGLKHVVYTDIARDGMQTGVSVRAYREMAKVAGFPVVASGGVATLDDIRSLGALGPQVIESVIVGRALYEGNFTVEEALAVLEEVNKDAH